MSHILDEIQRRCEKLRKESPAYMKNRTYHLCMEDRRLSAFTQLWVERYKPCPFTMRDAAEGVRGCIVVSIRDSDGRMLDFISEAKARTGAKIAVDSARHAVVLLRPLLLASAGCGASHSQMAATRQAPPRMGRGVEIELS